MKVYIVTEYYPANNATIINKVFASASAAEKHLKHLQSIVVDNCIFGIQNFDVANSL